MLEWAVLSEAFRVFDQKWQFKWIILDVSSYFSFKMCNFAKSCLFCIIKTNVRMDRIQHNVKASSMLCLLAVWTWETQIVCQGQCLKWMLRVCNNGIPGCAWGYIISSRHTFRRYVQHTGVGCHSTSSPHRAISGPKQRTSRVGGLRF